MQEREILEVEQGTSSSENIDGVYTLSITGEDLEAAIEQVEENKTNIETLQTSTGTINSDVNGVKASISGINTTIDTMTNQINSLNSIVGNEGSLTKAVTTLQGQVGDVSTRLSVVEGFVSEENEFEDRVSSLETRLNKFNSGTSTIEAYISSESESLATVKSEVERLDSLKVDEEDAPITLEQFYAGTTNTLTAITGVLNGTEEEPKGLVTNVSEIKNRLNYFNNTADTLEKEFEELRLDVDEKPWESYTDEAIEPIENSITALESNFESDGYVTKGFNTLSSGIRKATEDIAALQEQDATLSVRVLNLEIKTEIKEKIKSFTVPASNTYSLSDLVGVENILGFELTYAMNTQQKDVHMLYIPYESINYFSTQQVLPGTTISLQITPK
jgi:chromosome segregation ATPase